MKYETFKKALDCMREIEKFVDGAQAIGVELFENPAYDAVCELEAMLIEREYGEIGWDWVSWYLWELPQLGENKAHAWQDDKPIDLSTDEKLWEYVETECKRDKENE